MSDTKTKRKPGDTSIMDYYQKITGNDPFRQAIGAAVDLAMNWKDMVDADTLEADKYYHCKGNCEAAQRGEVAKYTSTIMSDVREYIQSRGGRKNKKDTADDQVANNYGRTSPTEDCKQTCRVFRPTWLNKKHW